MIKLLIFSLFLFFLQEEGDFPPLMSSTTKVDQGAGMSGGGQGSQLGGTLDDNGSKPGCKRRRRRVMFSDDDDDDNDAV